MKKFTICLNALLIAISLYGCKPNNNSPQTEYGGSAIVKIETSWVYGMDAFPRSFVRTFDFGSCRITDAWVSDSEYIPVEEAERYNTPVLVATFDAEQGQNFIEKVTSLGILNWKDRYETSEVICDGGNQTVTIYLADGAVKSTYIYFEYPQNYEKIQNTFSDILGAAMYCE